MLSTIAKWTLIAGGLCLGCQHVLAQTKETPAQPAPSAPAPPPAKTAEPSKPVQAKPEPGKPEEGKPGKGAEPQAQHPVPTTPPPGTRAVVVDLSTMDTIIGKNVKSATGEDMGHIIDLLVETNGQTRAAIIDFGGVLGVGSRKVAIDWRALDFSHSAKGGYVKLALTRNQVRLSPEYRPGEPIVILEDSEPETAAKAAPAPAGAEPKGNGAEASKPAAATPSTK